MNWFERYGIVGMFFWFMTFLWLVVYFPDLQYYIAIDTKVDAELIVGFCTLTFIPIGYLLNVFSQNRYYSRKEIHCKHLQNLNSKLRDKLELIDSESFGDINTDDEVVVESVLTYYDRKSLGEFSVAENKFISEYATKRYAVMATNRSFICAVPFSVICACLVSVNMILHGHGLNLFIDNIIKHVFIGTAVMYVVSSVIVLMLFNSCDIMEKQIVELGKRKLSNLKL